jgi:isoleucyl-tRNA synthetase
MSIDLKDTLNLPKTEFPMRADLVQREPERLHHWTNLKLYERIQNKNKEGEKFILHDGPPFTNGDYHIGGALNKILKDITLRYRSMRGNRTPFVPGWDCHGLPIEHKVMREHEKEAKTITPISLRKMCAEFSEKYIERMTQQVQRLGMLADWKRDYRTMNPSYEAGILRTFANFVEKDAVYRSKKPVYWSIPCKTALAEGEVEYKEIENPSIWVKFTVINSKNYQSDLPLNFVIWTTTPWTLPGNKAIAVHPELNYVEIEYDKEILIVAETLAQKFIEDTKLQNTKIRNVHPGKNLEYWVAQHPLLDQESLVILGDHITTDVGTGCVHTAPGHGLEDYYVSLKYNIEVESCVDDDGCLFRNAHIPAEIAGASILTPERGSNANQRVIELLKRNHALVYETKILHSYPHCWRSKTPLIFRAMSQWFIGLDKNNLREKALTAIKNVKWIPSSGEKRIVGSVESRPDWCISRQRAWGTPLPVFYDETGTPFLDAKVIRQLADKFENHGSNIWFSQTAEELLNGITLPHGWHPKHLTQGTDTMDVWIDSGCSHTTVLRNYPELSWPADIYFEGSDQHRGWFQSSLWTSVICYETPPYKSVITHGFVVDETRKKISKSSDMPQTSEAYVNQHGADIIRLWVSSEDFHGDIPISDGILKQVAQTYRTIRNTLRFQIGNLYDFTYDEDRVNYEDLLPIDQWALKQVSDFIEQTTKAYDQYEYHQAFQLINILCTNTLSAVYHDILKDRLYTFAAKSIARRSAQTVIHYTLNVLLKTLAPILVFTADEAFSFAQGHSDFCDDSVHLQNWPKVEPKYVNNPVVADVDALLNLRSKIHEQMELLRQSKQIGSSNDACIKIYGNEEDATYKLLYKYRASLEELFIVSYVEFSEERDPKLKFDVLKASGERCPRSWKWVPTLVDAGQYGRVSPRSREALLSS